MLNRVMQTISPNSPFQPRTNMLCSCFPTDPRPALFFGYQLFWLLRDMPAEKRPSKGFQRVRSVLAILGGLYTLTVIVLLIPFFQSQSVVPRFLFCACVWAHHYEELYSVLYMNSLKYPFFAKFDTPETYGLARQLFHPLIECCWSPNILQPERLVILLL